MSPNEPKIIHPERLRLQYLDGLRGLAAFYVVFHHTYLEMMSVNGWLPDRWAKFFGWAGNGYIAVQIFIVLSGYCLTMPVARSGSLKGGWLGFIKRRARRILPPYYGALAFSLAIACLVPGMNRAQGLRWDRTLPAFTSGPLISHLLLLQDIKLIWIFKINSAMWTIAQEWQIYFVFAFLLVPIWRSFGIVTAVVVSFVVSVALGHLGFEFASPKFLFLFGVGMFAAVISFPGEANWLSYFRDRLPWGVLTAIFWVLYLVCMAIKPEQAHSTGLVSVAGAATLSTLVFCTGSARTRQGNNLLLRIFEANPVVILGTFSYSLYLIHAPVLAVCTLALHHWQAHGLWAPAIELFVGVPMAVALAYGFHLVAERPFMLGHPESLKRAEKAAILDTAP
jgi:peptidoglycan/LPS O-acetylase OafA/YrhL